MGLRSFKGVWKVWFKILIVILPFFLMSFSALSAQNVKLKGTLVTDANKPVPNTRMSIAGGPSETTDFNGKFQFRLSDDFIEGERVIISVIKEGWVINYPLDGVWNLPNIKYEDVHTTKVIIVPLGSMALWTHGRIEKHIAELSDELAKIFKTSKDPQPMDFSYYLKEWATKYGFTPNQVKTQFDQWAETVKNSTNFRTLGLRAFYLKNFVEAAKNFQKAALQGEEQIKNQEQELRQKKRYTYKNWKDAGSALYTAYKFRKALEKFQRAETIIKRETFPLLWAEIQILIGNTETELGIRVKGNELNFFLTSAIKSYHRGLEVYSLKDFPQQWAITSEWFRSGIK